MTIQRSYKCWWLSYPLLSHLPFRHTGAVLYYGTCSAGGDWGKYHKLGIQISCTHAINLQSTDNSFLVDTASVCVSFLHAVAWINGTELEGSVYLRGNAYVWYLSISTVLYQCQSLMQREVGGGGAEGRSIAAYLFQFRITIALYAVNDSFFFANVHPFWFKFGGRRNPIAAASNRMERIHISQTVWRMKLRAVNSE